MSKEMYQSSAVVSRCSISFSFYSLSSLIGCAGGNWLAESEVLSWSSTIVTSRSQPALYYIPYRSRMQIWLAEPVSEDGFIYCFQSFDTFFFKKYFWSMPILIFIFLIINFQPCTRPPCGSLITCPELMGPIQPSGIFLTLVLLTCWKWDMLFWNIINKLLILSKSQTNSYYDGFYYIGLG